MLPALDHIETWIFDLDNTLYPASADLFGRIDARMGSYIQRLTGLKPAEARALQKRHFLEHGTTLAGLMATHGIEPREFLDYVHDIEMDALGENAALVAAIARLPGRKLVFTNGDADYAGRVLARLGLGASFEAIHDIHACAYRPKPDPSGYAALCARFGVDPPRALMMEDMVRNLAPAKALGMTTVWVDNGSELGGEGHAPGFVDYEIADPATWLGEVLGEMA